MWVVCLFLSSKAAAAAAAVWAVRACLVCMLVWLTPELCLSQTSHWIETCHLLTHTFTHFDLTPRWSLCVLSLFLCEHSAGNWLTASCKCSTEMIIRNLIHLKEHFSVSPEKSQVYTEIWNQHQFFWSIVKNHKTRIRNLFWSLCFHIMKVRLVWM